MYFEFDDVRRIHQPYTDSFQRGRRNKLYINHYRTGLESSCFQFSILELEERHVRMVHCRASCRQFLLLIKLQMEPINHFKSHVDIMNQFYEWPKTRSEYNIFIKEVFRLPEFWPELFKKY